MRLAPSDTSIWFEREYVGFQDSKSLIDVRAMMMMMITVLIMYCAAADDDDDDTAAHWSYKNTALPSAAQLSWMQDEMGAIGSFNMVVADYNHYYINAMTI